MSEQNAKRVRVTMQEFVAAWENGNSVAEVAAKLNMNPASVAVKASKYRKDLNIPLKVMARKVRTTVDVNAALAQIAEIRGVKVEDLVVKTNDAPVTAEVAN